MNWKRLPTAQADAAARPDFALFGARVNGTYYVYASADLTQAELEARIQGDDRAFSDLRIGASRTGYHLKTEMNSLVVAFGASYAEALHNLFAAWTPPDRTDSPAELRSARERFKTEPTYYPDSAVHRTIPGGDGGANGTTTFGAIEARGGISGPAKPLPED